MKIVTSRMGELQMSLLEVSISSFVIFNIHFKVNMEKCGDSLKLVLAT